MFRGVPGDDWLSRFGAFFDVSGALREILPLTFADHVVPEPYAFALRANYGTVDSLRSWRADGVPDNEIVRLLHASGVSLPGSILLWCTAFDTSLGRAREAVRNAPAWAHRKESDEELQDEFAQALEQLASEKADQRVVIEYAGVGETRPRDR